MSTGVLRVYCVLQVFGRPGDDAGSLTGIPTRPRIGYRMAKDEAQ